ncbi:MAG: hypothetical protein K2Q01_03670 [Rickettsiales bacterium]|nr:hypothetical protein [Rickettsiales bacterium]
MTARHLKQVLSLEQGLLPQSGWAPEDFATRLDYGPCESIVALDVGGKVQGYAVFENMNDRFSLLKLEAAGHDPRTLSELMHYVKLKAGIDIPLPHAPRHLIYALPETDTKRLEFLKTKMRLVHKEPRYYGAENAALVFHSGDKLPTGEEQPPFFGLNNHVRPRRLFEPSLLIDRKIGLESATGMSWEFLYPDETGALRPLEPGLLHTVRNTDYLWLKTIAPVKSPQAAYKSLYQYRNPELVKAAELSGMSHALVSAANLMGHVDLSRLDGKAFCGNATVLSDFRGRTRGDDENPGFNLAC